MHAWNEITPRSQTAQKYGAVTALAGGAFTLALLVTPSDARACGCFAPPDPSVPVLQAGERIVFAHQDGKITAHIQIQYQGEANEFGWLLPLPSVPKMKLGVDELFTQLIGQTQPKYRLNRVVPDSCRWSTRGRSTAFGGMGRPPAAPGAEDAGDRSPLVIQASIGPYDYAVLHADNKQDMFDWLTNNHYFIPTGTDDVVGPYIHQGAYFLALKLQKGQSAGDLQPVIVEYASELPMIPIILSSVAANPNMGIQVWVLGENRAIPRNYRHTILNEEHIDWFNAARNYNDVVIKAVNEAAGHHSFITEYAGTTGVMKNVLDAPGRFGDRAQLERSTDVRTFTQFLRSNRFPWSSALISILKRAIPYPQGLARNGITEDQYYQQIDYILSGYRQQHPELFQDVPTSVDAAALAAELWTRIVEPTLEAGKLFTDNPKMTRLYTTLSPEDMTLDPVFDYNKTLPDVSNVHEATLTYLCDYFQDGPANTPGILKLPDGREFYVKNQTSWAQRNTTGVPYSTRIELLSIEGAPKVEVNNANKLSPGDARGGCSCSALQSDGARQASGAGLGGGSILLTIAGGILLVSRRRRAGA